MTIVPGLAVHTPLGKGTVREVRNNGRVLVDVRGRALVFPAAEVSAADRGGVARQARQRAPSTTLAAPRPQSSPALREVDLHGLTVEEALSRAAQVVNDALLENESEVRFIHGRSGGRIRGALHRWLGEIASVSGFRVDPRNPGVTVVML